MVYVTFFICFLAAVALTPLVRKLAIRIGATDLPNARKVHKKLMPRMGGLAIYLAFLIGIFIMWPDSSFTLPLIIGSVIIIITGILDDMYSLSPRVKMVAHFFAALVIVQSGISVTFINLPFNGVLHLYWLSVPLTLLWIMGITNAINLIDGLDGLAVGVSSIVLMTIAGLALTEGNVFVFTVSTILLGSTLGFLPYNFHPAKIFMGDTGSYFLGYVISVLALLGFKNVTLFSLVVPIILLAVPISDTLFAIVRRLVNKKPLTAPDKSHLHHCLLRYGFSQRQTVVLIYGMSAMFALAAILFSTSTLLGSMIIIIGVMLVIELVVEGVGLVSAGYKPLLNTYKRLLALAKVK
ncbi:glycosyltransferase family 4 protein [Sporolactobacillus terrae]|uniref:Undecaprenyl-phosphate alpha-N-acetylglucosaminyl 1-phosphate transferase n=1 Tax=Sporolactobacillus terrae TaxID=269673 RepID=A0A410D739_9BACL|nr:MraY family glycosyltransferase [Sporolactobacillus terrae]QAA21929.1 undecaprenyl/decaprenyl-phosphate alpha-N-acetylglucosaminyl 1-phosphate transferase [Sporolactobacillus terrae]QAA24902.1 undecaprenyl/decaprenyl-phosphate alpha-N-acetylglucosaminyl 1-phosphate transferase [Sporolactobacillus terrae]UAK16722.1 undecaprenyl/decaprenyl-phosphate alpha-N-acetylglucosaminyl 1-phosphate transferase [Sporolactobacillus terrae]BBN98206.1 undecaprenyl-phosphate alpha-N-acetylglucosaminyl 1-phosp